MAPCRLKTLYGVGVMHYGKYSSITHPKAYEVWGGILERCYSEKSLLKHPTYANCTVCVEWHNFQNFVEWFILNYTQGYHIDKDLLILGNTEYSPDTCVFIPRWLNNILLDSRASRGNLPLGVRHSGNKYVARISCNGSSKHLGSFNTIDLAYSAYCKAKGAYLIATASLTEIPSKIRNNLLVLGGQFIRGETCQ